MSARKVYWFAHKKNIILWMLTCFLFLSYDFMRFVYYFLISNNFGAELLVILTTNMGIACQRGRGHLAVHYTGTQSFITTFSFRSLNNFEDFY